MKSYRIDQPRPKPPRRSMQDTATPGEIFVHNGCTADLAIPCWYLEVRPPIPAHPHDRMRHDMLGYPTPDHPDHVCQEWDFDRRHCRRSSHDKCDPPHCRDFIDMGRLIPIHLTEEGYDDAIVTVLDSESNAADGITATASIDERDDWIVRVAFDVKVPSLLIPSNEPEVYFYSVFLIRNEDRDLAAMGRLTVLPAPIGGEI